MREKCGPEKLRIRTLFTTSWYVETKEILEKCLKKDLYISRLLVFYSNFAPET